MAWCKSASCNVVFECAVRDGTTTLVSSSKHLLATVSPVFDAMFFGSGKRMRVETVVFKGQTLQLVRIHDCAASAMRAVNEHVFDDTLKLNFMHSEDVVEIAQIADKYQIGEINEKLRAFIDTLIGKWTNDETTVEWIASFVNHMQLPLFDVLKDQSDDSVLTRILRNAVELEMNPKLINFLLSSRRAHWQPFDDAKEYLLTTGKLLQVLTDGRQVELSREAFLQLLESPLSLKSETGIWKAALQYYECCKKRETLLIASGRVHRSELESMDDEDIKGDSMDSGLDTVSDDLMAEIIARIRLPFVTLRTFLEEIVPRGHFSDSDVKLLIEIIRGKKAVTGCKFDRPQRISLVSDEYKTVFVSGIHTFQTGENGYLNISVMCSTATESVTFAGESFDTTRGRLMHSHMSDDSTETHHFDGCPKFVRLNCEKRQVSVCDAHGDVVAVATVHSTDQSRTYAFLVDNLR